MNIEQTYRSRIIELRRKADIAYGDGDQERGEALDRMANEAIEDLHAAKKESLNERTGR